MAKIVAMIHIGVAYQECQFIGYWVSGHYLLLHTLYPSCKVRLVEGYYLLTD